MTYIRNHDGKGTYFIGATWISYPGPIPDDLPDEFDLDDFDEEPDLKGMARANKQKEIIWATLEDSTANAPDAGTG